MKCKSGAQSGDLEDTDDIDAVKIALNAANAVKVTSFEYHMRLHQQRRDTSGAKNPPFKHTRSARRLWRRT